MIAVGLRRTIRARRNQLLRSIRAPLVRSLYRTRIGWRAELALKALEGAGRLRASTFVAAAHMHLLYVLNRHEELSRYCWSVAVGSRKYRRSQLTLHMLLKSAWTLQDAALLEFVIDILKGTNLTASNQSYIGLRKGGSPVLSFASLHATSRARAELIWADPRDEVGRQKLLLQVGILDTMEAYELPQHSIDKLAQITDSGAVQRFLGRIAVRAEAWTTANGHFDEACRADPQIAGTYTDLGETALYFPDPLTRIDTLLSRRTASGVKIQGYDKLAGYRAMITGDFVTYLTLRDDQVSNQVAHQTYHPRTLQSMGHHAKPFSPGKRNAFVIGRDGVSDELRWAFYYTDLPEYYAQIGISCDPRLRDLFTRSFPKISFYPVARNWGRQVTHADEVPRDRVPNLELATRLNNLAYDASLAADEIMFIEDVPLRDWKTRGISGPPPDGERSGATLTPDAARVEYWKARFAANSDRPAVGLIWRSGLVDVDRQRHYMKIEDFQGLSRLPVTLYSIQHQVTDAERAAGQAMGVRFIDDEVDFYNDFNEIAAVTAALDLVVGISTLPYEMAAAVGTDCWLCAISPLGRWMRLGRDGTVNDRLTRNGRVYFPHVPQGYMADRATRVDSILHQISDALADRYRP